VTFHSLLLRFVFNPSGAARLALSLCGLALWGLPSCVPLESGAGGTSSGSSTTEYYRPPLQNADVVYDENIRSVQCYVVTGDVSERLNPPVTPITQDQPIRLEFDRIRTDPARLVVKLQLCNADWTPAQLVDQQFLFDFNEFYISEYYSSVNTKVPYYHYRFTLPKVKLTGNYVVHVSAPDGQPLLSRRVIVYENVVGINFRQGIPPGGNSRQLQQVDFDITYGQLQLVNPVQEVRVRLRQNYRWDNARYPIQPTFVREADRRLEYQLFNFENAFPALNEFRFFDSRSLRTGGFNIAALDPTTNPRSALLAPEKRRQSVSYEQYNDINGFFLTDNREYGNGDTDADYATTTFQLRAEEAAPGEVYVVGQLTDWQLRPEYHLTYDATAQLYRGTALIKQGYYNYYFALRPTDGSKPVDYQYFEGSRFETENVYDMLVYYRAPGTRYDQIIGYQQITFNSRLPVRR
jgi:Domain of unknown function (DUF5103)